MSENAITKNELKEKNKKEQLDESSSWFVDEPAIIRFEEGTIEFAIGWVDMKKQEKKKKVAAWRKWINEEKEEK